MYNLMSNKTFDWLIDWLIKLQKIPWTKVLFNVEIWTRPFIGQDLCAHIETDNKSKSGVI